jgi:FMN phosphatase YigB (HAD superfamily)
VFDLGKVLVDFDYSRAARRIAARSRRTPGEVQGFIDHSPLLVRFETGWIDRREFFEEVCHFSGFQGTETEFGEFFADIFSEIEPMVALHRRLHRAGVPEFIFSNTNDIAIGHIRSRFPFFGEFTGYVFSYEERCMKPDAPIYAVVERRAGCDGPRLLYVDDRLENVRAGAARGWQVIHHTDVPRTLAVFASLGLD